MVKVLDRCKMPLAWLRATATENTQKMTPLH
jgi:hypothetical protein